MRIDDIVNLAKRRGFIAQSSEIYGGFSSSYDYGPLGVELKNSVKSAWWNDMVYAGRNVLGLDAAILMNPKTWEASGHLGAGFADPLVECISCHRRFRKDQLKKESCPDCDGKLTKERKFNLMMKTFVGPVEDAASETYLRAETAQGIYLNFPWILESMRLKPPFGLAQIGKAFRNEITPGNFTYRMREFEQMEMQWFFLPAGATGSAKHWFEHWREQRLRWYLNLGIKKGNLRFHEHKKEELAHYAKRAADIQYRFPEPLGWQEIEGIHYRGDWDLSNHAKYSGRDLSYFDSEKKKKCIPHVMETSAGADRAVLVFLIDAYEKIAGGRTITTQSAKEEEIILRLHPALSPVKVAVLPLVKNKPRLVELAQKIYEELRTEINGLVQYDESGTIGRRYRRQDEIGTPFCITVDFESLEKDGVTVRDRDTMKQERIETGGLADYLTKKLET
ncbi:MAG: glycine--tRNA ligase [Parcubacteria group bacterium RIFCSPLOWO2_01_FULL_48_18]|nr:MAG: glycine--tRNA ligase [Parcubacteria group bacterium RIFCSPHIGHO2_02_FULL_48_10b]OHB22544.1 MAG: glycine--tRNA ligase [Parcubacteria group bacterium RIFCSPLOWO2_01_FULL_48_18]